MATDKDLTELTDAQLDIRAQRLMRDRAEAERGFKADLTAIARERDRRALIAKIAAAAEGATPAAVEAALDAYLESVDG